jgi:aspartate carbamoyltransferase catalytic subunit
MNRGVEMAVDPAELPGSTVLHQVANGVAVRMAVLFELLGSGGEMTADTAADSPDPSQAGPRS